MRFLILPLYEPCRQDFVSLLVTLPVSHILPVLEHGTMMKDELELPGNIFVVWLLDMSLALCLDAGISGVRSVSIKQLHVVFVTVCHGHCSPYCCEQGAATPWRGHHTNYNASIVQDGFLMGYMCNYIEQTCISWCSLVV